MIGLHEGKKMFILKEWKNEIEKPYILCPSKTRPYTRQHQSRTGGQGLWCSLDRLLAKKFNSVTDQPTDRPTDRVTYRVACARLKRKLKAAFDIERNLSNAMCQRFLTGSAGRIVTGRPMVVSSEGYSSVKILSVAIARSTWHWDTLKTRLKGLIVLILPCRQNP